MICNSLACLWNGLQKKAKQLTIKFTDNFIWSGFNTSLLNQFNVQLAASSSKKISSKSYSISEVEFEKLLLAWQKRQ